MLLQASREINRTLDPGPLRSEWSVSTRIQQKDPLRRTRQECYVRSQMVFLSCQSGFITFSPSSMLPGTEAAR